MIRIVANNGVVSIDNDGIAPGRGGYLHPQSRCLKDFAASKVKEFRSLKSRIDRAERLRIIEMLTADRALDKRAQARIK